MSIFSIPDIIAFIFNGSIAIRILSLERDRRIKFWLFSIISLFIIWNLSNLITLNLVGENWVLISGQITYRILFLLPAFTLSLCIKYWNYRYKQHELYWHFTVFILPVLLLALSFPDFNLKLIEFSKPESSYYFALSTNPNPAFFAILLLSIIYISLSLYIIIKERGNTATIRERYFIRLVVYGLNGLFLLFFFFHLANNYIQNYSKLYFLKTAFLLIQILFFYLIVDRLERKDHQSYTSNFLSYLIFTITVAGFIFLIQLILHLIDEFFHIDSLFFDAIIILLLALFFQPAEVLINRIIIRKIKIHLYSYRSNFLRFTDELIELLPIDQLVDKIKQFIISNFYSKDIYFFKLNEKVENFEGIEIPFEIDAKSEFIKSMLNKQEVIEFYDLPVETLEKELQTFLNENEVQIVFPIQKGKQIIMFFALTVKANQKAYTHEELEILSIFRNEISLYLHRNFMFEKMKEEENEKFRLEKLAALGKLTAGIAHEIRNPLNTISTSVQTLQKSNIEPEVQYRLTGYINEETQRLAGLVSDFLELSRIKKPEFEKVAIDEILDKLIIYLKARNPDIQITIENEINDYIISDKKFLYQIITNIAGNSIEAIENQYSDSNKDFSKAKLAINAKKLNENVVITIVNNGPEIPKDIQDRIFEPFFTTKEKGTGLGLLLVENMVQSLKGKISLKSTKLRTQFIIKIPQEL